MSCLHGRVAPWALAAGLALAAGVQTAAAETRLEAHYSAYLAIVPVTFATGTLKATLDPSGHYVVDLVAMGLGFGLSAKSTGAVGDGKMAPATAAIDTRGGGDQARTVRMAMSGGMVRLDDIHPPLPPRPRVPLTDADRYGILDPVSALLIPAEGDKLAASMCNRTLPIFEGTERFNIVLTYLRTEQISGATGYHGPALVCRARYKAVAGHRIGAREVPYMEHNDTIEAWLVPVAGTRLLVPWRISLGTLVGTLVIEADDFHAATDGTRDARAFLAN